MIIVSQDKKTIINLKNLTEICYCWYMWEKGWKGETTVRWI